MGRTAEQVYEGLAGLFIIDDDNSDRLELPKTYGVDDIPLIVQDRNLDADGELVYRRDRAQEGFGELGDTILVNGTYAPFVDVPKTLVRFRLLNASNARRFNFGFSDNRPFHQIATDGGFLERPMQRTRLLLAPGERAEIVVDFSRTSDRLMLVSDAVPGVATMFDLLSRTRIGQNDRYQAFNILQVRAQSSTSRPAVLAERLNTIQRLDPRAATRTRVFHLTDRMSINRKMMDARRIDEVVRAGDLEIWEIRDEEALFYHTFHIHGVQFQELDRNGRTTAVQPGWKDTVSLAPFETVRVVVRFADYGDEHVPYMFHCHILDHEDQGMMGQFVVERK
jgi:bilirubin oxidase